MRPGMPALQLDRTSTPARGIPARENARMRQLSHDAFARTTEYQETVKTSETCTWCGSKRPDGRLYRYGTQADGIQRPIYWSRLFCSQSCHKAFAQ